MDVWGGRDREISALSKIRVLKKGHAIEYVRACKPLATHHRAHCDESS